MDRFHHRQWKWWLALFIILCGVIYFTDPMSDEIYVQTKSHPNNACSEAERIVAVGDLHGDLLQTQAVLKMAALIDAQNHWVGGKATLVQTGDFLDRGDDGRGIMDLLMQLQSEATRSGGKVLVLLGNHEVMNLQGDWRYVTMGDVDAFGGINDRRKALSSQGRYGAWLRQANVVVRLDDTIFVHGGLTLSVAELGISQVNTLMKTALSGAEKAEILGSNGPTWYRSYSKATCDELKTVLHMMGAKRMVVGHTRQRSGRIQSRCNRALVGIDIGIAKYYGAHTGALELSCGNVKALYPFEPNSVHCP